MQCSEYTPRTLQPTALAARHPLITMTVSFFYRILSFLTAEGEISSEVITMQTLHDGFTSSNNI